MQGWLGSGNYANRRTSSVRNFRWLGLGLVKYLWALLLVRYLWALLLVRYLWALLLVKYLWALLLDGKRRILKTLVVKVAEVL